ncbi:MAG TPA: biotin--[acetyl-CoA-carboxylase] ligase [Solirubrobacteraceae bacterium]|jgi:BirA family biotin operon repressor/biotin-[acetyl-CoA-carboxylase] ligase|nr:biotin--[acetyl-CoA-carboxylase] ligase [Solirubrobacteraceae bacterium]
MSPSLGHPRLHLRSTDSTNDRARALAIAGAPHGTLVTASAQTAGRGRQGRRWSAPPDSSLLMSLVLRNPPPLLPLIAAVAVCDVAGDEARVKWPNDIVVVHAPGEGTTTSAGDLAKLAGILAEGRPQEGWALLGVGLNVAVRLHELPAELRATAATLGESPDAIEPALARLLAALDRRLAEPTQELLAAYRARDALRGREIGWSGGHGRAEGIDGEGRLVVALPGGGGNTTLDAGEVHLTSS